MGADHENRPLRTVHPSEMSPQIKHWQSQILSLVTESTVPHTCGNQNLKFVLCQTFFDAVVEFVQALLRLSAD